MDNLKVNECLLVSIDFTHGKDIGILLVGRQHDGKVDIINAFQGQEAIDIYKKLITVKKGGVKNGFIETRRKMPEMPSKG